MPYFFLRLRLLYLFCFATIVSSTVTVNAMMMMSSNNSNKNKKNSKSAAEVVCICDICEAKFPSRNKLFQHLRQDHTDEFVGEEENEKGDQCQLSLLSPITMPMMSASDRTAASLAARHQFCRNDAHEKYYEEQLKVNGGVFKSLQEWQTALECFRTPLPIAFRISQDLGMDDVRRVFLQRLLDLTRREHYLTHCPSLSPTFAQVAAVPIRQWTPESQQALIDAQEVGAVHRQEVCSMIPPLLVMQKLSLFGNPPSHGWNILDLCAAPGSKSLELLDLLMQRHTNNNTNNTHHQQQQHYHHHMLVCNDSNRQRLLTVARRSRRQPSHQRASLLLNSSDGRYFPSLRKWGGGYKLKFHAVLVDAPCSGDGTLRKLSTKEWKQWNVKSHLQLHKLQIKLLARALECVTKGGHVVYSTCSLDPIENEAVLVSAIARMGGPRVYRIVSIHSHDNPKLQQDAQANFPYTPGATSWVVPHPQFGTTTNKRNKEKKNKDDNNDKDDDEESTNLTVFQNIAQVPKALRKKDISPSMFPPSTRKEDMVMQVQEEKEDDIRVDPITSPKVEEENGRSDDDGGNKGDDDNDKQEKEATDKKETTAKTKTKTTKTRSKLDYAKYFGDIIPDDDIPLYEEMLPNACRILPQHLDSGGFFCAIIQRVAPAYYAICYPQWANSVNTHVVNREDNATTTTTTPPRYHGRILYNPDCNGRQLRDLLQQQQQQDNSSDGNNNNEVFYEGLPTKEQAIQWLRNRKAYLDGGISDEVIPMPTPLPSIASTTDERKNHLLPNNNNQQMDDACANEDDDNEDEDFDIDSNRNNRKEPSSPSHKRAKLDHNNNVSEKDTTAQYSRIFRPPHPSLVQEFCDFFGLFTDQQRAADAGVECFPVDRLVITGGGDDAYGVTTCLNPEQAHTEIRRDENCLREDTCSTAQRNEQKVHRRRRYMQLTIVSKEIQSLFKGGAKFSPMETGLSLCWVPIPGLCRADNHTGSKEKGNESSDDPIGRAVRSGRYGLLDEGTEFLGKYATRRVVALTQSEALELIESSFLSLNSLSSSSVGVSKDDSVYPWWNRWGKQRLHDVVNWDSGAVIAVFSAGTLAEDGAALPTVFLPCALRGGNEGRRLEILMERRFSDPIKRLLEATK